MEQRTQQTSLGKVAYRHYHDPKHERTLVCIHGYDRTSRDFTRLAESVAEHANVICPDLFGRGDSEWLSDKLAYHPENYATAIAELLRALGVTRIDLLGTSMGSHVATLLAGHVATDRLLINDLGPFADVASFRGLAKAFRARKYAFSSFEEADEYSRILNRAFGLKSHEDWLHCTHNAIRSDGNGGFVADYDPELPAAQESATVTDRNLWSHFASLRCPTLVVRGEKSRVLQREVAEQMVNQRADVQLVEVPGVGHAPMFYDREQIALARNWFQL